MDALSASFPRISSDNDLRLAFECAGWYFCDDIDWAVYAPDIQTALHLEASQEPRSSHLSVRSLLEPTDLSLVRVDMTRRFAAMASSPGFFFYISSGFVAIALAVGYMCIPCEVPTNFSVFLFVNRAVFNSVCALNFMAMTLLFLPENMCCDAVGSDPTRLPILRTKIQRRLQWSAKDRDLRR